MYCTTNKCRRNKYWSRKRVGGLSTLISPQHMLLHSRIYNLERPLKLMIMDFHIETQNAIQNLEHEKESYRCLVGKNIAHVNNEFRTSSSDSSK
jgi:hypothetical protein